VRRTTIFALRWLICGTFFFFEVSALAAPRKRVIAHSRDLLQVRTEDVWRNRDKFAEVGCDGILMTLDRVQSGGTVSIGREVFSPERFDDIEFEKSVDFARECLASDGLRESFALVSLVPGKRLAWDDDQAWELAADNVGTYARAAKSAGFRGLSIWKSASIRHDQFMFDSADPAVSTTLILARKRGRQFFGSLFREFPNAWILSLCLFNPSGVSNNGAGDLWPHFLNGLLDVLPPTAKIIDGNGAISIMKPEGSDYYRMLAARTTYDASVFVAAENQVKYATQVSVGFGLCVDLYNAKSDLDRRRFILNLSDAASAADDLVWIAGKGGTLVDWELKGTESKGLTTWESQFGCFARVLRTAGGDLVPFREGVLRNELRKLVLEVRKGDAPGAFVFTNSNKTQRYTVGEPLRAGDVVYVRFREKGQYPHLALTWKFEKKSLPRANGSEQVKSELIIPSDRTSDDEWRWIDERFVVPEGADGLELLVWGPLARRHSIAFEEVEVYLY